MPPVRVAIANDYEIVIAGIVGLIAPFEDRVEIVELAANKPIASDVHIVLYDTFGQVQGDGYTLAELLLDTDARVVVFTWNLQPELIERAVAHGARGYLSKALSGEEIVEALEAIRAGEVVVLPRPIDEATSESGNWPGRAFGLTQRESEVLALITRGLTNQEIADRAYISINSVKTYVRTAYRKIGVTRRSQAVSWGMQHGFQPDYSRTFTGA